MSLSPSDGMPTLPERPVRSRPVLIGILGIGQILAWGSSYYLPTVLAKPVAEATGWSMGWVIGSLSIGLLVSGLVSPRVGHWVERYGGRPVLAGSAILLAVGLLNSGAGAEPAGVRAVVAGDRGGHGCRAV